MPFFYFFNCYFCGEIYYSKLPLTQKKCIKCNKLFFFQKAYHVRLNLTQIEAIKLLQYLKEQKEKKRYFSLKEEIDKLRK